MIRIGREIQCLPYAGFLSNNCQPWYPSSRFLIRYPSARLQGSPGVEASSRNGTAQQLKNLHDKGIVVCAVFLLGTFLGRHCSRFSLYSRCSQISIQSLARMHFSISGQQHCETGWKLQEFSLSNLKTSWTLCLFLKLNHKQQYRIYKLYVLICVVQKLGGRKYLWNLCLLLKLH